MRIVLLDGYTTNPGDLNWSALKELGQCVIYDRTGDDQLIERAYEAEILMTNKCEINEEAMKKLPNLRCICLLATGFNNIDIEAAKKRNITVCNAVGYGTKGVAQHAFALIMALENQVHDYNDIIKVDGWADAEDWTFQLEPTHELSAKIIGIYGLGAIGQELARLANAFGMKIIATRKNRNKPKPEYVEIVDEKTLITESDILSLHAPLTSENEDFINRSSLARMKHSAFLINTGRGGLVDEEALHFALENGLIKGAALDVLKREPPRPNHPLLRLENCIITPHIAWSSYESRKRLIEIVAENVRGYISGNPTNVVN